jgi:hypothetical protein
MQNSTGVLYSMYKCTALYIYTVILLSRRSNVENIFLRLFLCPYHTSAVPSPLMPKAKKCSDWALTTDSSKYSKCAQHESWVLPGTWGKWGQLRGRGWGRAGPPKQGGRKAVNSQQGRWQHGAGRRRKDRSGVKKKSQRAQSEQLQEGFLLQYN